MDRVIRGTRSLALADFGPGAKRVFFVGHAAASSIRSLPTYSRPAVYTSSLKHRTHIFCPPLEKPFSCVPERHFDLKFHPYVKKGSCTLLPTMARKFFVGGNFKM